MLCLSVEQIEAWPPHSRRPHLPHARQSARAFARSVNALQDYRVRPVSQSEFASNGLAVTVAEIEGRNCNRSRCNPARAARPECRAVLLALALTTRAPKISGSTPVRPGGRCVLPSPRTTGRRG